MAEASMDLMVPADQMNAENFAPADLLADWIRPLIAEFLGPFALMFLGAGSAMLAVTQGFNNGGTLVMVALAHGLAIGLMIAAAGHISGGHYNPAVTIGLWIGGKIGALKGLAYIGVQLAGAVVAALILKQLFDDSNASLTNAVPAVNYAGDSDFIIVGRTNALDHRDHPHLLPDVRDLRRRRGQARLAHHRPALHRPDDHRPTS